MVTWYRNACDFCWQQNHSYHFCLFSIFTVECDFFPHPSSQTSWIPSRAPVGPTLRNPGLRWMFMASRRDTNCTKTRKEGRDCKSCVCGDGGEGCVGGYQDVDRWNKKAREFKACHFWQKGEPIQDIACWEQEFAKWLGMRSLKSDTTGSETKPCHLTACILLELFICPVTQFLLCLGILIVLQLMLLNCGVGEDSCKSLGLQGDPTSSF